MELPIFSNAGRERGADPLITARATQRPSFIFRRADAGAPSQIELDVRLANGVKPASAIRIRARIAKLEMMLGPDDCRSRVVSGRDSPMSGALAFRFRPGVRPAFGDRTPGRLRR